MCCSTAYKKEIELNKKKVFNTSYRVHFVGIGGIGMSGIAEVMHNIGYQVQGSDISENANVKRLKKLGIPIFKGHDKTYIHHVDALVISSAVKQDNPEIIEARMKRVPIVKRAQMLSELMRLKYSIAIAGTHGKTTTTSLIALLMDQQGYDPTVINGGVINAYRANAKIGKGEWMVVEADESDGSFTNLNPTIAVVTNIDAEHMDYYGSFEAMTQAYEEFVENLPFYGCAILCADHHHVQTLQSRIIDRKIITYGFNLQADVRAFNLRYEKGYSLFDIAFKQTSNMKEDVWKDIYFSMHGDYNIQNAMAAIAAISVLGIDESSVRNALKRFSGVKRRFTEIDQWQGIRIIDDYGHHPVEISAVLKSARNICSGRLIAICQPHRYSRLKSLFDQFCCCFNDADNVFITPVYAAGEDVSTEVDSKVLVEGIRRHGHQHVDLIDRSNLAKTIFKICKPDDLIVFLGAGDITQWAHELKEELEKIKP